LVLAYFRQKPAQMNLHMRLPGTQVKRPAQQRFRLRKLALIFTNQAQELQPVRLAGIGGKHLRQQLVGLSPLALLNQVCGPQN
jgi:hypothetical protein